MGVCARYAGVGAPVPAPVRGRGPREDTRGHRRVVEHYLTWCRNDAGPARERRRRYEVAVARDDRRSEQILLAPARFDEYRSILAATRIPE